MKYENSAYSIELAQRGKKRAVTSQTKVAELVPIIVGLLFWTVSFIGTNPNNMTGLGLVSVLPVWFYLALLVLTSSFVYQLFRGQNQLLIFVHCAILALILFGTPQLLYGTVRYTWTWKHIAIINYFQQTGKLDPTISFLSVYDNWPGFFIFGTLLNEAAGFTSALAYAGWGPVFFNLIDIGALIMIFRSLTRDTRIVWLGVWFFLVGNWIGQDYFSPQAFTFFLYLVIIGIILRWFRVTRPPTLAEIKHWIKNNRLSAFLHQVISQSVVNGDQRSGGRMIHQAGLATIVILLFVVIVSSHQLTPFMAISAMALLGIFQVSRTLKLPLLFGALVALWVIYMAVGFLQTNVYWIVKSIGQFASNTQLANTAAFGPSQILVTRVSQGYVIFMVGLALLGLLRRIHNKAWDLPAVLLMISPIPLLMANNYGGEMHLRVYYFALPFIAFLAAALFFPHPRLGRTSFSRLAIFGASCIMLGSFFFAAYGKEQMNYIPPNEVSAINYLIKNAAPGSLLMGGTSNWPMLYQNYEKYNYLNVANLSRSEEKEFLSNPISEFAGVMKSYPSAYVIITSSQEAQVSLTHILPPGSLQHIESTLSKSPYFQVVYQNPNATIISLRPGVTLPPDPDD